MPLRPYRERVLQSVIFEAIGLALVIPAYAAAFGQTRAHSTLVMLAISAAVLVVSPLHNWVYDRIDWHRTGRTACRRSGLGRLCHAVSHELALMGASVPILMLLAGHTLAQTLMINLWMTLFYVAFTALFHLAWDRLRPLPPTLLAI